MVLSLSDDDTPLIGRRRRFAHLSSGEARGGSKRGLGYVLSHFEEPQLSSEFTITFGNEPIWTSPSAGIDTWIRFLTGFAAAWNAVRSEETYPLGTTPKSPSLVGDAVLREMVDPSEAERISAAYQAKHDLGSWFQPRAKPRALWLMREGRTMVIEPGGGGVLRSQLGDALNTWITLGDAIAERLSRAGERATEAVRTWRARDKGYEGLEGVV